MSPEKTVLVDVLPGDQTGIYYIPICNLPFNVLFRRLKSWIRKGASCEVDHVEIFFNSTSGWVRLNGKDNFEKAWKLLSSGRAFDGRSIIADDKNRTQTITIKKKIVQPNIQQQEQQQEQQQQQNLPPPVVAYSQTPGNRPAAQGQQAAASSTMSPQYSSTSGQYYAAGYNQAGGPSYSDQSMPTQGYPLQPTATTDPWEYYNYSAANAGPSSGVGYSPGYQYDGTQFALPYRGQQEAPTYYAGGSVPGQEPAYQTETEFVTTEARKLHVSPFPQKEPRKDVERWIRQRIYEKQTIKSIDIPMNGTNKYLRGHVFVVFDSASSATRAMEQLNKASYQGRKVTARPTVEGVAVDEQPPALSRANEASIPTGPRNDRHRGDKPQRPRHREPDRKRPSSDKKSSSSAKKSSKTSSMKTLPDKDKKGSSSIKDAGPPLVVDGSSRRRDKR
ncbi:RRM domain-containing protein [Fusarium keratoplasticum]|nr:RRM domain-containing protein [Fusarium keratoplasticum]